MTQPARAPHQGTGQQAHAPNAALLIDFDNVTMGIRSDLTRELRNLLDSEVIRGKVAVQRAYADWRRYPQYIVPLSEASIDLIFAPAYGSSKKNATDIRLAIDALELVFTRPEIGTFMLLSGDSDFSSLVLKLKEYGKYVIGVGIRESASDLLVQNCDEYYSYSALTGLTAAGEDEGERHDPWELVERAVLRMEKNGDVMRSDRLKQVMIEMDPGFDEKELGFTKYNKFLAEAASKSRLALTKLENGQYEVASPGKGGGSADGDDRKGRGRGRGRERGRRGGRRDDSRESRESRSDASPAAPDPVAADSADDSSGSGGAAPEPRRGGGPPKTGATDGEEGAFALLARAVADIADGKGDAVRDSELKRRMLEIDSAFDEATLGFSKFSRFLRRAHDEEVIDLNRTPEGHYEAVLGGKASAFSGGGGRRSRPSPEPAPDSGGDDRADRSGRDSGGRDGRGRGGRGRRGREDSESRGREDGESREDTPDAAPRASGTGDVDPTEGEGDSREASPQSLPTTADRAAAQTAGNDPVADRTPAATAETAPQSSTARGYGRGRRGGAPSGPPPLLPGQAVGPSATASTGGSATPSASPVEEVGGTAEAAGAASSVDESAGAGASAGTDGPSERGSVIVYLSRYKGVGARTATAVVDAFGPHEVFRIMDQDPERVRDLIGPARAQMLLDGWAQDPEADARR